MREVILIAAMTQDRAIGSKNRMTWDVPEEFDTFLAAVAGNVVLMGRTSYEMFEPDLGDTVMVAVSSTMTEIPGAVVCPTVEAALEAARSYGKPVFVSGGASIYAQTLPYADELWLSIIDDEYVEKDAAHDAFFPEFDESDWELTMEGKRSRYTYRVYKRREGRPYKQWGS